MISFNLKKVVLNIFHSYNLLSVCLFIFITIKIVTNAIAEVPNVECPKNTLKSSKLSSSVYEKFHIDQFIRVESRIPSYREGTFGSLDYGEGGSPAPNIRIVGDLNNDGIDDLIIEYIETGVEPVFMLGSVNGTFSRMPFKDNLATRRHIRNAELFDVNNDGFLDFVGFTTSDHVEVWKRYGVDLVPGEDNILLINQSGKSFKYIPLPSLSENEVQHGGTVADINNDGFTDIIGLNEENGLQSKVIRNIDGEDFDLVGTELSPEVTKYWIHDGDAGDLNGDGFIDLVISLEPSNKDRTPNARNLIGTLQIILGDGDFDFSNNNTLRLGSAWLTQSEAEDVVRETVGDEASLNLQNEIQTGTVNVELVDLNGDGLLDILDGQFVWVKNNHNLSNQLSSGFKAYLNRGDCFEDATLNLFPNQENNRKIKDSNPTNYIEAFHHQDISGDGLPDLVIQSVNIYKSTYESFSFSYPYIFINQNNENYLPVDLANVKPLLSLAELVTGDFNGDGKVDLAALGRNKIVTYLSNKKFNSEMLTLVDRTEKYDRTLMGLSMRFECFLNALVERGDEVIPSNQVEAVIKALVGNKHYRTKRHLKKMGLSEDFLNAHKSDLLRLVNFEGANNDFCTEPLR